MSPNEAMYEGFANALPAELRPMALALPSSLGLLPSANLPFDHVFSHEVTHGAPELLLEALPEVSPERVRIATLSHTLAVVETLGRSRVSAGRVQESKTVLAVLDELRAARARLSEQILPGAACELERADRSLREAIGEERALLRRIEAASFEDYRRITLGKQAVRASAALLLAQASGASERTVEQIRRALRGVWLGLEFEDDAGDWEEDFRYGGGAWAVSLARRRLELGEPPPSADQRPTEPNLVRSRVFRTGVLHSMLRAARQQYRSAYRHARLLGAERLASWADQRVQRLDDILPLERRFAGYTVRARRLAPWAVHVLT
jgi:hypothetical protein